MILFCPAHFSKVLHFMAYSTFFPKIWARHRQVFGSTFPTNSLQLGISVGAGCLRLNLFALFVCPFDKFYFLGSYDLLVSAALHKSIVRCGAASSCRRRSFCLTSLIPKMTLSRIILSFWSPNSVFLLLFGDLSQIHL